MGIARSIVSAGMRVSGHHGLDGNALRLVQQMGQTADSPSMSTQDAFLSDTQSDSQRLLAAYLTIEEELKAQAAAARRENASPAPELTTEPALDDSDELITESSIGWIPRLRAVEGISEGRLGPLHGKLIALGLLKFQLTGRTTGILYRLSPEGRAELKRPAESVPNDGWGEQSAA